MIRPLLAASLVAVAVSVPAASGSPSTGPGVPKLTGKVTASTISLKTGAGSAVRSIPQNTYKVSISDTSKAQNFHLSGPGVNRKTKVAATTKTTWTVTLTPGTYVYRSDKSSRLRGTFTVTTVPPPAIP